MNRLIVFLLISVAWFQTVKAQDFKPVTYEVIFPEKVSKSDSFSIVVTFQTYGEWYIYAPTGLNEKHGMIETKLQFDLPEGITLGAPDLPMPKPYGMYQIYQGGDIKISQHFNINSDVKPGVYEISCSVTYQTCNKSICLPPDTQTYKKIIHIN